MGGISTEEAMSLFHRGLERVVPLAEELGVRILVEPEPDLLMENTRDFKQFIRQVGMTHVRTSPYYPQSNGKLERWHGSLKQECIRPGVPLSLDDARTMVERFVDHYNCASYCTLCYSSINLSVC